MSEANRKKKQDRRETEMKTKKYSNIRWVDNYVNCFPFSFPFLNINVFFKRFLSTKPCNCLTGREYVCAKEVRTVQGMRISSTFSTPKYWWWLICNINKINSHAQTYTNAHRGRGGENTHIHKKERRYKVQRFVVFSSTFSTDFGRFGVRGSRFEVQGSRGYCNINAITITFDCDEVVTTNNRIL